MTERKHPEVKAFEEAMKKGERPKSHADHAGGLQALRLALAGVRP